MAMKRNLLAFTGSLSLVLTSPLMVYAQITGNISGEPYNPYQLPIDQANQINSVFIPKEGKATNFQRSIIPKENIYQVSFPKDKKPEEIPPVTISKISPVLNEWLQTRKPTEEVDVIITFPEDQQIPLLPELKEGESRDVSGQRQEAIEKIKVARTESQLSLIRKNQLLSKLKITEHFWIVNAVAVKIQLGLVRELAQYENIAYIQPVEGGEKPPSDGIPNNDVDDARGLIHSDPYFNLGLTNPWIGILDTGIRRTHVLFNSPSNIAWVRDAVNGGASCNNTANPGYNPFDTFWNHGTSTAAIISGNNSLGNAYRGVTGALLDSWQIYTNSGLNSAAAIRGIQCGISAFDKVLVGELQANETETGAIATAADNAYNAGVIFVAANGNYGPGSSTVRSPGIAHKVLGVGAFNVIDGTVPNYQGRGPATDGRFKPDIQAPTDTETASNASDTALGQFGGTSGATPYASGVAMLARNWLRQFGIYDNGQTYAFMILYGQKSFPYDNTQGAGKLKMATNGWANWGKTVVTNGATIDIPITIGAGKNNFDGALWWPESASQAHNDIDIYLIDPTGVVRANGISGLSVFERAKVSGALASGTWKIRIRGYSVPTGGQVVYWASHYQN